MAFEFEPGESVADGVRRIVGSQVARAAAELGGADAFGLEEAVHAARKRFKKARAVVRLARGGLGRKVADRENARFRDAGRPLSEVRDAAVLIATLDGLAERGGDWGIAESFGQARGLLVGRHAAIRGRVLDRDDVLPRLVAVLDEARRDVRRWEFDGGGWDLIEAGLGRIYRQGAGAFGHAAAAGTDDNLHEFRKRVKDLWYALTILGPIRPGSTRPRLDQARDLAEHLGADHDLAVLRDLLSTDPDLKGGDGGANPLLPLIDAHRADLQAQALPLGASLYDERPRRFVARFRTYWRAWRAESRAARLDLPPDHAD